jgi:hypothetical protein
MFVSKTGKKFMKSKILGRFKSKLVVAWIVEFLSVIKVAHWEISSQSGMT